MNDPNEPGHSSAENPRTAMVHAIAVPHAFAIVLGCLALAGVIFCGLDRFPGLHGDEAWFGLAAQEVIAGGVHRVSGMTWYTGNLYPLTVAGIFALFGAGVFELRAPGAAANAVAFLVLALTLARSFGFRAGWFYLCLVGTSLYAIWQSRIGWEVTASTLPLLALVLIGILPSWNARPTTSRPMLPDLCILGLLWIGTLSHVIFVVATFAFAGAAVGAALLYPDRRRAEFVVLMACAVSTVPFALVRTTAVVDVLPAWQTSLLLVLVPPAIAGLLYACTRGAAAPLVEHCGATARGWAACAPAMWRGPKARLALLALLLAPFVVIHGPAFTMAVSGLGPAQRMASVSPDTMTKAVVIAFGVGVIGLLAAGMALAWRRSDRPDSPLGFLVLATALSFILLPAVVSGTSLRYYAIPQALLLVTGAAAWGSLLCRCRVSLLAALTLAPVVVCGFALNEQLRLQPRPPINFRLGRMAETSAHFLPHAPLIAALRDNRSCNLREPSFFIEKPVQFVYGIAPWPCDPNAVCRAAYCLDTQEGCAATGRYFAVSCSNGTMLSSAPLSIGNASAPP